MPTRLLCPWVSLDKNIGVGCHALFQGIFLTQGLNLHLLHLWYWPGRGVVGGADGSQQGSTWGFCPAFLNYRTDFLLESPRINEPIVLLPEIIRLWGDDKKGTETIFEKFSKVSEGHTRPPLPFISAGSRKGETRGDCVVGSFGRGLCYSELRLRK